MEVVAASPSSAGAGAIPPYQRRDVEEWSHLDHLTGMLEHARVEKDHWAASTHNSQHKYGKVVDSRDRCAPDGSQQQRQRRQLEVFQAQVPGGSLQVIRTQTVASSSSRWSSASSSQTAATNVQKSSVPQLQGFENLQLALNPLDLSSQKTKASVGRSGSIGGRRPPSRPRSIIGRLNEEDATVSARLQRVSQLCQQFHDDTINNTQNLINNQNSTNLNTNPNRPSILDRQNGDGSVSSDNFEISELNGRHNNLEDFWRKSTSNSDSQSSNTSTSSPKNTLKDWKKLTNNRFDTTETASKTNLDDNWRKSSNSFSKSESSSSINRFNTDVDADRRLNTALRGNNVDLEALDQILKSISSSSSIDTFKSDEQPERDDAESINLKDSKSKKRHSFITVESLQEVRGRLRRLSSPIDDYKSPDHPKDEEPDDGIVAEDTSLRKEESTMPASNAGVSRVRSYVYGMEAMLHNNKKPIIGTGSLESRTSSKSNGNSNNRSEDWYNRRKSYGFEQVHNQQIDQSNSISLRSKNKIESSTDSGICRSTEIVVVPSVFKPQQFTKYESPKTDEDNNKFNSHKGAKSYGKIGNSTVINLNGDNSKSTSDNELFSVWNRRALLNGEDLSSKLIKKDTEQITITIPIVSEENTVNTNNRRMFHRQMSDGTSMSIESSWSNQKSNENLEVKRHSIAVDESKYVSNKYPYNQIRRTSLAAAESSTKDEPLNNFNHDQDDEATMNFGKKQKKVEFCKTEVHFAAESGRVNIVETDEKPPPTQNFRRRRRNSSVTNNHIPENFNKTGLPLIHFGDTSYEKKLFSVSDSETVNHDSHENFNKNSSFSSMNQLNQEQTNNTVTISSVSINQDYEPDKEPQENENQPRGILKNKMIKPKPYLLGDENNELISRNINNDDDSTIWGVRLRPIHKQEDVPAAPIWRSTVTVQNTSYNVPEKEEPSEVTTPNTQPEFQKLLHSLRPARKSEPSIITPEISIEKRNTVGDLRRSSWSVADRIKQAEELKQETKGYSTRVNFGGGEATVVENGDLDKHTTWPRQEELHIKDDKKKSSMINKGLVVRIGREDSNHTVCSKTTTNHNSNSTTTTTKITIDMSSSPTSTETYHKYPIMFNAIKLPRASLHSLKSTSLIMNTFSKPENVTIQKEVKPLLNGFVKGVPDQLAVLKQLYEEAAEHSDDSHRADEEVRSYMSANGDDSDVLSTEDEISSVVSGSWSKMRAFKNMKQHLNSVDIGRQSEKEIFRNVVNRNTYTKKDYSSMKSSISSNVQKKTSNSDQFLSSHYDKQKSAEAKITSISATCNNNIERKSSNASLTESPKVDRKINNIKKKFELERASQSNELLSSPLLVGNSVQKTPQSLIEHSKINEKKIIEEKASSFHKSINQTKESPSTRRKIITRKSPSAQYSQSTYTQQLTPKKLDTNNYQNHTNSRNTTEKSFRKWSNNKPDLLKHNSDIKEYVNLSTVIREDSKNITNSSNKSKIADIRKVSSTKPHVRPDSPTINRPESPIYENIDEVISNLHAMEKESSMLQELTKAADQILQAVNGYTDEDSKVSTDSEDDGKKHRLKLHKADLSTISETKSWKQVQNKSTKQVTKSVVKNRVRPTSSTSSIESLTKESKPVPPVRLNRATKLNEEKTKKKITGSNSELSKITKARRLQRASSREALLQSHGSSSEDIATNMEIRKPRLVRRTKTQQGSGEEIVNKKSTLSNLNVTTTRKNQFENRKSSERVPVVALQEIRHKTAVSTIKSTAEKAASREKALKAKSEEQKKKNIHKRDTTSSRGSNLLSSSHHGTSSTHRSSTIGTSRGDHGLNSGSGGVGSSSSNPSHMSGAAVRTSSGVYVPAAYRCNSLVAISRPHSECPCLCS